MSILDTGTTKEPINNPCWVGKSRKKGHRAMTTKKMPIAKPIEPIEPVMERSINISLSDFLSAMEMPESMKTMFSDFYKKIGVNWITRDQWLNQWKKFKKLSPVATDKARRKGMML